MTGASVRRLAAPATPAVGAVGVDVTATSRIAALLARQPRFRVRCFTAGEAVTCGRQAERWAGRWAAKEAVRKVYGRMGWRIPAYRAIEVVRPRGQAPVVMVDGAPVPGLEISMTHDAGVAIAVAALGVGPVSHRPQAPIPADLRLPERPPESHKGTYGTVLIVAGSSRFPGAAALCALGALRGGAGKVACATPVGPGGIAAFRPEVILCPLPAAADGGPDAQAVTAIGEDLAGAAAVVCGPGLGSAAATAAFLAALLQA
ncbi:MAG TPA: NAD(P)H-hydrate dehydratase, partial [Candidatus Dormibacteraeota bacterium]|nr:NAD(P)H-hydrate dehydratase [Candidatus Dormibacteraeota bacterium]